MVVQFSFLSTDGCGVMLFRYLVFPFLKHLGYVLRTWKQFGGVVSWYLHSRKSLWCNVEPSIGNFNWCCFWDLFLVNCQMFSWQWTIWRARRSTAPYPCVTPFRLNLTMFSCFPFARTLLALAYLCASSGELAYLNLIQRIRLPRRRCCYQIQGEESSEEHVQTSAPQRMDAENQEADYSR